MSVYIAFLKFIRSGLNLNSSEANVPPRGFEPLTLSRQRSERCAYANSATEANKIKFKN